GLVVAGLVLGAGVEAVVAVAFAGGVAEARRGRGAVGRDQRVAAVARPLGVQVDEAEAGGGAVRVVGRVGDREPVGGRVLGRGRRGGPRRLVDQGAGVGRRGGCGLVVAGLVLGAGVEA